MKLQTQLAIPEEQPKIDYSSKLLLLGSCFSENIGAKFRFYKFQTLQNPFGILFHPFAIENFLERVVHQKEYTSKEVFQHEEIWSCFEAHSRLNALSETELVQKLNFHLEETYRYLKEASHIFITLGTAWTYKHVDEEKYVANCHKLPQKNFKKELSSASLLKKSFENSIQLLQQLNPKLKVIFTISPVRHLKDGFVENQQSKAHLITALHQLIQKQKDLSYFPSYEIMLDELRDYRFYTEDLLHPNAMAIQYIWGKLVNTWFSENARQDMKEVSKIQKGLQHKAFNPNSEKHQAFSRSLQQKILVLQRKYPNMEF